MNHQREWSATRRESEVSGERDAGRGRMCCARTILYKVVQARDAVVPWRLRGKPAEYGARLGGRWWIG